MASSVRVSYRLSGDPLPGNETRLSRKELHTSVAFKGEQLASDVLRIFSHLYKTSIPDRLKTGTQAIAKETEHATRHQRCQYWSWNSTGAI
jgi:hypothetical protein